MKLASEMLILD